MMDYDAFHCRFPSEAFLEKHVISKAAFKRRFMFTFFVRGFLGVGMSDVGIAELYDQGAIGHIFGRPYIKPWKFDATKRYRLEVAQITSDLLNVVASLVHQMQDGMLPFANLRIDGRGFHFNDTTVLHEDIPGCSPSGLRALAEDMCSVIGGDAFVWDGIGTFTVEGETIVCEPMPERPARGIEVDEDWELAEDISDEWVPSVRVE